ncbi:hypothetical protein ACFX1R_032496 [Malus domestica]
MKVKCGKISDFSCRGFPEEEGLIVGGSADIFILSGASGEFDELLIYVSCSLEKYTSLADGEAVVIEGQGRCGRDKQKEEEEEG